MNRYFTSFSSRESSLDPSSESLLSWPYSYNEQRSEGYDEYFDPPLESKYECPICLLGLRGPVQTTCGHRFCRGCILRSIRDAGPKCPVDNEPLVESQLYPDNFAKREMMALSVFCRLHKERACPWKGPLGSLEDHLKECPFVDVECPNNCQRQLQRKDLQAHVEKECPLRRIPCQHCQQPVLWSEIEKHASICPKYPLQCDKCGEERILREKMAEHLEKVCPQVETSCPFAIVGCLFKGLRSEVNKHVNEQLPSHVMELAEKVKTLIPSGDVREEQQPAMQRTRGFESLPREQFSQEGFIGAMSEVSTNYSNQQREVEELRRLVTNQSTLLDHLERRLEDSRLRHERQIQDLNLRLNRYETKLIEYEGRVCNGSFIWRIENYRQCRQDAINGVMTAIHSPAFHTSLYGYKLCMRINLNGVDSGINRHVALFVHMMQGDYDDILDWPFTGRIALSILDQSDGVEFRHHISETLVAKPNLLAFQRPTSPRNYKGYGYVEFAPIEQICEPQYVKNNTMLVRIQIFH